MSSTTYRNTAIDSTIYNNGRWQDSTTAAVVERNVNTVHDDVNDTRVHRWMDR